MRKYRSRTFSNTTSSTISDDWNRSEDNNAKVRFIVKVAIGIIEFFLSSVFFSYGILFYEYVYLKYYDVRNGLWTMIFYSSFWQISAPWSKLLCDFIKRNNYEVFKYVICTSTFLLFTGIVMPGYNLFYGIFGGIFSNMITTNLKAKGQDNFDLDPLTFHTIVQVARASSLLFMPHVMLLFLRFYQANEVKYIFGALLFNIIPVALILSEQKIENTYPKMSRYQTLPAFSAQVREMMKFLRPLPSSVREANDLHFNSSNCDLNDISLPNENKDTTYAEIGNELPQPINLTPLTIQTYYRSIGVSILPEIPEEQEEKECKIHIINKEKLIRNTSKPNNKINNQQQKNGDKEDVVGVVNVFAIHANQPDVIENIEYISNFQSYPRPISIKIRSCFSCNPYIKFLCQRRLRIWKKFLLYSIFKPFLVSAKNPYFYFITTSRVLTTIINTLYITLAPYLISNKIGNFQQENSTFLLFYISFSWCFFLVFLPLIKNYSITQLRITFIFGLILAGVSMFLFSQWFTNNMVMISCLLFGFGYGIIEFTGDMVYRSFLGVGKWKLIEGTLNTVSGGFLIIIYYFIYKFNVEPVTLLLWAILLYFITALVWIILAILNMQYIFLFMYSKAASQEESLF